MYLNYCIWVGFTLYVEFILFVESVRIFLWAICFVLEQPCVLSILNRIYRFRIYDINAKNIMKLVYVFIANSFVVIHPVFYTANHYDIFEPYDLMAPVSSSSSFSAFTERGNNESESRWMRSVVLPVHHYKANEQWHIVKDNSSGRWHIALVIEVFSLRNSVSTPLRSENLSSNDVELCVDVLVCASSFFRFPMQTAKTYLIDFIDSDDGSVVLASDLEHNIRTSGLYDLPDTPLLIKTHWIRIIQRIWKRIYAERMRLLLLRGSLMAQRRFELTGKYGIPIGDRLGYSRNSRSMSECS